MVTDNTLLLSSPNDIACLRIATLKRGHGGGPCSLLRTRIPFSLIGERRTLSPLLQEPP